MTSTFALGRLHDIEMINYNEKIDGFTISDGDRSNWFVTILREGNLLKLDKLITVESNSCGSLKGHP